MPPQTLNSDHVATILGDSVASLAKRKTRTSHTEAPLVHEITARLSLAVSIRKVKTGNIKLTKLKPHPTNRN